MLHRAVRPLLRLVLLCLFLGMVPPAPSPLAQATPRHTPPPIANAPVTVQAAPSSPIATVSTPVPHPEPPPPSIPARASGSNTDTSDFGKLPLSFIPNAGQADSAVRFHVRGIGGSIFFTPQEVVLAVPTDAPPRRSHRDDRGNSSNITSTLTMTMSLIRIRYEGAGANPVIAAANRLPGAVNYFVGNDPAQWHTNLPTYDGIVYQQLYPGIDLQYTGTDGQLKSTYNVSPSANAGKLRWQYSGAKDVQVDANGNLAILIDPPRRGRLGYTTPYTLTEQAPVAWQDISGQRVPVAVRFVVANNRSVSFALGAYDTTQPLTIDPTLGYSVVIGGSDADTGQAIALDSTGAVYLTGTTSSSNFPITNPLTYTSSLPTAFITKLNPSGTAIVYSTYLGGSSTGLSIAVDSAGSAYVTGVTYSSVFPIKNPIQQGTYSGSYPHGSQDAFVTKLSSQGNTLIYSTYLSGSINYTFNTLGDDTDEANGIAVDSAGNAYVTGTTSSTDFPMAGSGPAVHSYTSSDCLAPGVQADIHQAWRDAFVVRLHANTGSTALQMDYSTYLGGNSVEWGSGIALDSSGNAYVTGRTSSPSTSFPVANAWRSQLNGNDKSVTKIRGAAFGSGR